MERFRAFLRRKNIVFSAKRYGVDALGAMAQGLFCTLLVGTILDTLGTQFHIGFLSATVVTVGSGEAAVGYTIGGLASLMVGPAMAVAIGSALQAPPLVLFSLVPVGYATNVLGGAGGPLAVLVNENSASAAEIFAGAVQDHKVGTLVGVTTYGKGIVQKPFLLDDGSVIKLTISAYYTPDGKNIHGKGIKPDVTVEQPKEAKEDLQLEKAMEILRAGN